MEQEKAMCKHIDAMKKRAERPQWWHLTAAGVLDWIDEMDIFSNKDLGFLEQMLLQAWPPTEKQRRYLSALADRYNAAIADPPQPAEPRLPANPFGN
jgi:hypothetical protein